jgi:alanine dehydrogenase
VGEDGRVPGPRISRLLTDADVRRLRAGDAVAAARRALIEAHRGRLAGPPRVPVPLRRGELVFTVGGADPGPFGFRVYAGGRAADQLTAVWAGDGSLGAVIVGSLLGERRTGALGAVAVDLLARPDADGIAVIGSGRQAWAQLWAVQAVRPGLPVRVFSPSAAHRTAFADRARRELGVPAEAVDSAKRAVRDAPVVILATRAARPVIEAGWLAAGAHLTTVGPKTVSGHECPVDVPRRAAVAVSDAPEQTRAYGEPCFTGRDLLPLGALAAGDLPGRTDPGQLTFYLSTGLAGSEVLVAEAVLAALGPA